jgi:predicted CoA-binding protein
MSDDAIQAFLDGGPHAVVGASRSRAKYGNKSLRSYIQRGMPVYAVNPNCGAGETIEGLRAYDTVGDLPEPVHGVSIITPPHVTEQIVKQAITAGIKHLWMQPGAENDASVAAARRAGLSVIEGGPCILVVLGFRDSGSAGGLSPA